MIQSKGHVCSDFVGLVLTLNIARAGETVFFAFDSPLAAKVDAVDFAVRFLTEATPPASILACSQDNVCR